MFSFIHNLFFRKIKPKEDTIEDEENCNIIVSYNSKNKDFYSMKVTNKNEYFLDNMITCSNIRLPSLTALPKLNKEVILSCSNKNNGVLSSRILHKECFHKVESKIMETLQKHCSNPNSRCNSENFLEGLNKESVISNDHLSEIQCKNISSNLAKEIGMIINNSTPASIKMWIPPTKSGLENSTRIIPHYYLTNKNLKGNILEIDYFDMIRDDILNLRALSNDQMKYIENLSEEEKMELIGYFNECYKSLAFIL